MCAVIYGYPRLGEVVKTGRPLLMLDRLRIDADSASATGLKVVSGNEPYFPGHFPSSPIMPGVLQLGAMCQAAEGLLRETGKISDAQDVRITGVNRFKFRKPALPGDRLEIHVQLLAADAEGFAVKGTVVCEGSTVSQGDITLAGVEGTPCRESDGQFSPALPPVAADTVAGREECADIMKSIPHRFPFLLIDRQLSFDRENSCNVVVKNVSGGEEFFTALRRPVLPEYLQAEIAAQACCALAFELPETKGKLAYYMSIDKAVFTEEVVAGDQLIIRGSGTVRGKLGSCTTHLLVGDRQVAELSVKFILVDKE